MSEIDPVLLRIFYQIKQYQQTIMHSTLVHGIRDYMRFLLGFALRNEEIKESTIVNTVRHTFTIRLTTDD